MTAQEHEPPKILAGLSVTAMAHGGDGVGRHEGKAVFVQGAVPGDVVDARVTESRQSFDRAAVDRVVEASPGRTPAPCRHFLEGCGGCQWQMATIDSQRSWKRDIVASQLRHIGKLDVEVDPVASVGPRYGYRNRMDFRIVDGRPTLSKGKSHDPVDIEVCHILADPVRRIFHGLGAVEGRRLTIRAGIHTAESAVVVDDSTEALHEMVAGQRFRITGRAFFQVNTGGAEALVERVSEILSPGPDDLLLDGYAGGGLFSATVGRSAGQVVAVESDRQALADLRHNAPGARIVASPMERALAKVGTVDVAVVDPPRQGLGAAVVADLAAAGPRRIASVSCDPASFARDARLLVDAGYRLESVRPFDLFPQTYHIEIVGSFSR